MPPACSDSEIFGQNSRGDGALGLESLRMQTSSAKGMGKAPASKSMSAIAYDGPDIDDEDTSAPEREIPKVLSVIAAVLERLVARNEQVANASYTGSPLNPRKLTIFHGLRAPSITISKYLERIFKYTSCSPSCFVVGYVYIDRLIHRQPDLPVTSLNVHRLLVTSCMVATKMLDDVHFNNAFFARVGGVSTAELNRLELEFLFRLDFRLSVTTNVFESYCSYLEKEVLSVSQRVEKSLPAFGSVPPAAAAELTPVQKKRIAALSHVKLNQAHVSVNYPRAAISSIISRESPPSR